MNWQLCIWPFSIYLSIYLRVYGLHHNVLPTLQPIPLMTNGPLYPITQDSSCHGHHIMLRNPWSFPWPVPHNCVLGRKIIGTFTLLVLWVITHNSIDWVSNCVFTKWWLIELVYYKGKMDHSLQCAVHNARWSTNASSFKFWNIFESVVNLVKYWFASQSY